MFFFFFHKDFDEDWKLKTWHIGELHRTHNRIIMSFILKSAYMNQDADPEKIKMAEVQFDAMSKTFNTWVPEKVELQNEQLINK